MVSLVYFDELSLALVGFSLIMWITMPWAFEERLRKIIEKYPKSDKSIKYLENATRAFLASSIMFMIDTIGQLIFEITPTPPPTTQINLLLFSSFGVGIGFLVFAMVYTNVVITTLFHPEIPPEKTISETKSTTILFTRNLGLFVALVFFGTFDSVLFVFTVPYFFTEPLTDKVLIVAYAISIIGVVFSGKELFSRTISRLSWIGPVLIAIPWVFSVLIYVKVLPI